MQPVSGIAAIAVAPGNGLVDLLSSPGFVPAAGSLYTDPVRTGDVPTLTDDFAPVDNLVPLP